MSSLADARQSSSGRAVAENLSKLVDLICPSVDDSTKMGLLSYSMSILSSLVGSTSLSSNSAAIWAAGDKIERRLAVTSSEQDVLRFKVLRAELSTSKVVTNKAGILALLHTISSDAAHDAGIAPALQFTAPIVTLPTIPAPATLHMKPSQRHSEVSPDASTALLTSTQTGSTSKSHKPLGDARVTHYSVSGPTDTLGLPFGVSEALLVRDMLYVFQGIDGQYVKLRGAGESGQFVVVPAIGSGASASTRTLVAKLGELGWLFARVSDAVAFSSASVGAGRVSQALYAAVQSQLSHHFGEVAALTMHVDPSLLAAASEFLGTSGTSLSPAAAKLSQRASGVTSVSAVPHNAADLVVNSSGSLSLRALWVWAQVPMVRMRLLASLLDAVGHLRGGALASGVFAFTIHGDPDSSLFVSKLTKQLCVPLLDMIRCWIFDGELRDEVGEFFVAMDPTVPDERLWLDKYSLNHTMVPSFIGEALAKELLLIGKSINFVRSCCGDKEWVVDAATVATFESAALPDVSGLTAMSSAASAAVNKQLMSLLFDRFLILEHLRALKLFLLLGQGDFVTTLLDLVSPELDKPVSQLSMPTLSGCLEGALRSSSVQFASKEMTERLDVTLTSARSSALRSGPGKTAKSAGDSGWDVFALQYHVNAPINAVVSPQHLEVYHQLFTFLWRLRRVEYTLSNTWCRHMTASHKLSSQHALTRILHRGHVIRTTMTHFVSTLASYVMFEVLEIMWGQLVKDVMASRGLSDLIAAHDRYLSGILQKELMSEKTKAVETPLATLLDEVLKFCRIQDQLMSRALAEASAQEQFLAAVELRAKVGQWGTSASLDSTDGDSRSAAAIRALSVEFAPKLDEVASSFHAKMQDLLAMLALGENDVEEFRFLRFRLDFNEFYKEN